MSKLDHLYTSVFYVEFEKKSPFSFAMLVCLLTSLEPLNGLSRNFISTVFTNVLSHASVGYNRTTITGALRINLHVVLHRK